LIHSIQFYDYGAFTRLEKQHFGHPQG
jgi:hypothetical protein